MMNGIESRNSARLVAVQQRAPIAAASSVLAIAIVLAAAPLGAAHAASGEAQVASVRVPAWLARAGVREPLAAGTTVQAGDQLITGDDARIALTLTDGATLRIGEDAVVEIAPGQSTDRGAGGASASVNVLQGALQLTITDRQAASPHVLNLPSISARAERADIWVKSASDGELVCLVDGSLEIAAQAGAPVVLNDPLAFYLVKHDGTPVVQGGTDIQQMERWAQETYLTPGSGALVAGGSWRLELLTSSDQLGTLDTYAKLRHRGYPVEFLPQGTAQHRSYRITLSGIASEGDARTLKAVLAKWSELAPQLLH